jgi:Tol biopolymer transport system component
MKILKPFLILLTIAVLTMSTLSAETPRIGKKVFVDAAYPQVVGNTGLVSAYMYSLDSNTSKVDFGIGDPKTGKLEKFDLELEKVPTMGTMAWSNDGNRLALVRSDLTICDIYEYSREKPFKINRISEMRPYVKDLDSNFKTHMKIEDHQLMDIGYLDWSADDKKIAFSLVRITDASVWVLDVASNKVRQVTEDKFGASPNWAPDGKSLYIIGAGTSSGIKSDDIFRVNLDDYSVEPAIASQGFESYPQVSPDGRYVLYTRKDKGKRQTLYVYDLNNDKAAQLVILGEKGTCVWPTWSGDGKSVFYQMITTGKTFPDVYEIDFDPAIFR